MRSLCALPLLIVLMTTNGCSVLKTHPDATLRHQSSSARAPGDSVRITLTASLRVNPDLRSRPSPVVVRLFELRSASSFSAADFFTLIEKDSTTLGAELAAREEFALAPGSRTVIHRQIDPTARFLGVVVAFRDIERSDWRAVAPVPRTRIWRPPAIAIDVDERSVRIVQSD